MQRDVEAVITASPWSARRILALLGLSEVSHYRRKRRSVWQHGGGRSRLGETAVSAILDTARRHTSYGYRQVHAALRWEHPTVSVAPISVYRLLNRKGLVGPRMHSTPPTPRRPWVRFEREKPHELWQTDVSYWYIKGWGYYYLHTVLDDHSRYIITSRLYRTYGAAADRPGLQLLADHGVTYTADAFKKAVSVK